MIDPQKHAKAFRAIQGVLIVARGLAYHGDPDDRLVALLDYGEYLPGLVLEPEDRTSAFDEYLGALVRDFPEAQWILDEYQK